MKVNTLKCPAILDRYMFNLVIKCREGVIGLLSEHERIRLFLETEVALETHLIGCFSAIAFGKQEEKHVLFQLTERSADGTRFIKQVQEAIMHNMFLVKDDLKEFFLYLLCGQICRMTIAKPGKFSGRWGSLVCVDDHLFLVLKPKVLNPQTKFEKSECVKINAEINHPTPVRTSRQVIVLKSALLFSGAYLLLTSGGGQINFEQLGLADFSINKLILGLLLLVLGVAIGSNKLKQ